MSLLPRTPLSPLILSLPTACPLPETPQLTEPAQSWKRKKNSNFFVFWPFLQGQSWEQPGNHRVLCKERKLMGKGCARQIPAAVPAGCTCQAAQANPGAPGKVTFTGFLGFSGIHTPGRSWGGRVGRGVEAQGAMGTNWESSELCGNMETLFPWKSVQRECCDLRNQG